MGNKFDINTGMCGKCGEKANINNTTDNPHIKLFNTDRPTFEHVYMS